jgi:hypothetical protein
MKQILAVLLAVAVIYAGRISQWSDSFTLREPIIAIKDSPLLGQKARPFDCSVLSGRGRCAAIINVSGIVAGSAASLIIYEVNGKVVADLSGQVRGGAPVIVWNSPAARSGIFIARLQNGSKVKTIRFMLFK